MRLSDSIKTVFFAILLSFMACSEKDLYQPEKEDPKGEEQQPESEEPQPEFSTTQTIRLVIQYDVPAGYAAPFSLYTENPLTLNEYGGWELRSDIEPINAGIVVSGSYNKEKVIPAYVKTLYAYSGDLFAPQLMMATIINGAATFSIANPETKAAVGPLMTKANPVTPKGNHLHPDAYLLYDGGATFIKEYPNTSSPMELPGGIGPNHDPRVDYHDEIASDILMRISTAFPEQKNDVVEPEYLKPYLQNHSIYLNKEAEVWISILTTKNSDFKSSLGYFYYNGTQAEIEATQREKVDRTSVIAVPFAHLANANANSILNSGDYVQLYYYDNVKGEWTTKFPANTTIGFELRGQAYDVKNSNLTNYWQWAFYSINTLNEKGRRLSVVANAGTEKEPFICVGFEDAQNIEAWSDRDFNDVMFHAKVTPSSAIETLPPTIPGEEPEIAVGASRFGVLAYEDLWPSQGDYDLNDAVVGYQSEATLTYNSGKKETYLTKLEDTFTFLHNGASFQNKFGYKIDVNPSLVESITVNDEPYALQPDSYKDKNGFIIELTDNVRTAVNGEPFQVVITFKDGITEEEFEKIGAPYNSFITTPKDGAEVHLPRYYPTSLADPAHFGTSSDRSDVDMNIYYVSGKDNKYPFALHLSGVYPEEFEIPEEGKSIDKTYPLFINWVESGFKEYPDWYLIP